MYIHPENKQTINRGITQEQITSNERHKLASFVPHRNHKLFSLSPEGVIAECKRDSVAVNILNKHDIESEVIVKPGYRYALALNAKNAAKKFGRVR